MKTETEMPLSNSIAGKHYEDWNIGDEYVTASRTITETDIVLFAGLSGDHNPMHTNEEFAKKGFFKTRVAHGFLVLAVSSGLINQMRLFEGTTEAFLGLKDLKFSRGVLPGDSIKSIGRVLEKKVSSQGKGIISFEVRVVNQRGEEVSSRIGVFMIKRKSGT
jgi:acyl dehydratase